MTSVDLYPLPKQVEDICIAVGAPPRLVAHLTLVHDVATRLVDQLQRALPELKFDVDSVRFGAATHDIGKALYPAELTGAGDRHESDGAGLLEQHGISRELARFTRTHAAWKHDDTLSLEDLLVTLADTCWKGKRVPELDNLIAKRIAAARGEETWKVFLALDDILQRLADDADERLAWQRQFSVEGKYEGKLQDSIDGAV